MRDVLELYPRFLVFCGIMAAFLFVLLLVPAPTDATTMPTPVQTTAADTRQLSSGECRMDQHAYAPTCQMQGRTIRVIQY
jgi:hypothetical protein